MGSAQTLNSVKRTFPRLVDAALEVFENLNDLRIGRRESEKVLENVSIDRVGHLAHKGAVACNSDVRKHTDSCIGFAPPRHRLLVTTGVPWIVPPLVRRSTSARANETVWPTANSPKSKPALLLSLAFGPFLLAVNIISRGSLLYMPLRPAIALAASFTYLTILAITIELFRRRLRLAPDVSRKSLHIGIGLWSVPTIYVFSDPLWAILPYMLWGAFAYLSYRLELLRALEDEDATLGSIFFPLSVSILLVLCWGQLIHVAIAGIMAMTLGDTTAALVGRRAGTRKYRVLGHNRSMEGTLALFLVASASIACVLIFIAGLDLHQALAFSLISGTIAASVETASPYGSDNLTVPIVTAATLFSLINASALNQ